MIRGGGISHPPTRHFQPPTGHLSPADEGNEFNLITLREGMGVVAASWNKLAVDFDRAGLPKEALSLQELGHGGGLGQFLSMAIEGDLHSESVALPPLVARRYTCGALRA